MNPQTYYRMILTTSSKSQYSDKEYLLRAVIGLNAEYTEFEAALLEGDEYAIISEAGDCIYWITAILKAIPSHSYEAASVSPEQAINLAMDAVEKLTREGMFAKNKQQREELSEAICSYVRVVLEKVLGEACTFGMGLVDLEYTNFLKLVARLAVKQSKATGYEYHDSEDMEEAIVAAEKYGVSEFYSLTKAQLGWVSRYWI